jgi:hypothetical protein
MIGVRETEPRGEADRRLRMATAWIPTEATNEVGRIG